MLRASTQDYVGMRTQQVAPSTERGPPLSLWISNMHDSYGPVYGMCLLLDQIRVELRLNG
jgi:hypothetical protein